MMNPPPLLHLHFFAALARTIAIRRKLCSLFSHMICYDDMAFSVHILKCDLVLLKLVIFSIYSWEQCMNVAS